MASTKLGGVPLAPEVSPRAVLKEKVKEALMSELSVARLDDFAATCLAEAVVDVLDRVSLAGWLDLALVAAPAPSPTPDEDVLDEAKRITSGDRQNQYGPPDQDFQRTAQMWSALKGVPFEAREVAAFMIALKLSRQTHQNKRDNWVDIAGYARCGSKCTEGNQ